MWWWIAAGAVVAAGGALRLAGAAGDLWLDEIWSLELARAAPSAGAVFTALHVDNNHHLNTLYLMALGPDAPSLAYRMLAVLAGTALPAVAVLAWARRDRTVGMAWALLLAGSYLLVHYGSEARGFAPALLFAVACHAALDRLLRGGGAGWALAFAAGATLGLLSHLTFLYAILAFASWAAAAVLRPRAPRPRQPALALAFAPPLATLLLLWAVDLRFMVVGGGPPYRLLDVLRELLRTTLNVPPGPAELLVPAALAVAAWEVARLARERDPEWIFQVVVLLLGPAAVLLLTRPEYLAPRYFAVTAPFLLLLLARFLGRTFRRGRGGAAIATALLALFLAGGATYLSRLFTDGRGHYRDAVRLIVRGTAGSLATVGSDHDFRNGMVLGYHSAREAPGRLAYVPQDRWGPDVPQWVLVHRFAGDPAPDPIAEGPTGRQYRLVASFPYAGLSGWAWYVYRVSEAPPSR
jgi:uncharacterized membrane protein